MSVFARALDYVIADFSVAPIRRDGSKSPAVAWKEYQGRLPTDAELRAWFGGDRHGIALIMGQVSENAETIDIDDADLVQPVWERLRDAVPELRAAVRVRTPRPGGQVIFRRETRPPGNHPLAERLVTGPRGLAKKALIETRGEAGYVVGVGSPADVHSTKRPYVLSHGDFAHLPVLSDEEVEKVYKVCRSFDDLPAEKKKTDNIERPKERRERAEGEVLPGDEFNARVSWSSILEPHGWTYLYTDGAGVAHWRRPGKATPGGSATTGYGGQDLLIVFSTGVAPFKATSKTERLGYTKFSALALLDHGGDFHAAAKALAVKGFGMPQHCLVCRCDEGCVCHTERGRRRPGCWCAPRCRCCWCGVPHATAAAPRRIKIVEG